MRRILVIEDDEDIANLVALHLRDSDCEVEIAEDGTVGLALLEADSFDLLILDLMLPGVDGLEICRRIQAKENDTPILMLTARTNELDRILGLEMGADDYLTKPFSVRELLARVKAILRRTDMAKKKSSHEEPKVIHAGGIEVIERKRQVKRDGEFIDLTAKEFDLLWFFMKNPGHVYNRSQLLDRVWGYGHDGYEHTVNSHINRLRSKIESDPSEPRYILTVWGVGYKFSDEEIP
ncbi:MAG: response regulator transcription factor [Nitrospira sp.]|nr:response regulator transcription factor [Candidatus Manganitrophaceae bacterium]HIL34787.1 response regulator transcription factor [Candidatus Manganitrophaceae bacterium]